MFESAQDRLLKASECGDLAGVKQALLEGASLYQRNDWGKTALHAAAEAGHLEVVQWLVVEAGLDPNQQDHFGETALHAAAYGGHLAMAAWLVMEAGVDPNQVGHQGASVLHAAVAEGHLEVVQWLVITASIDLDQVGSHGVPALGDSINEDYLEHEDHLEVARYLLSHGASELSSEQIVRFGPEGQTAYQQLLQDRMVQEKREMALAFPGNLMVHRAIDQNTHQNFSVFYEKWRAQIFWGVKPTLRQECSFDVPQQEADSKTLFKEHCNCIVQLWNSPEAQKARRQEQFLFFSLGAHIRAGEASVVKTLPEDVLRMICGWLYTKHFEGGAILQVYRNALAKAGLDADFNFMVHVAAPDHRSVPRF